MPTHDDLNLLAERALAAFKRAGVDEDKISDAIIELCGKRPRAITIGGQGELVVAKGHEHRVRELAPEYFAAWQRQQRPSTLLDADAKKIDAALEREAELAGVSDRAPADAEAARARLAALRPLSPNASDAQKIARAREVEQINIDLGAGE